MVTGDGMNDISMFEIFPNSYAPSNAQDEIKKLAGEIVCSSEDDGFAQSVERVLKINMLQWM
jgi:hydroxymethylpyrimidine pyrophosphatase-like HAD family hydrolase